MHNFKITAVSQNILILMLISTGFLSAQAKEKTNSDPSLIGLEIDGMIISETISKIGNDFYDIFYTNWNPPPQAKNYTITILEKPFPLQGNLITVKVNDSKVFERFVQPRYESIVESVNQAIKYTANYLINYERIQKDLGGEDLSGTGIY